MADRKNITPRIRFEVFKRDKFTCQYCGAAAPTVVLHCDHIEPLVMGDWLEKAGKPWTGGKPWS